ncbi:TPA: transcriptional regulator [Vibrio cholerae]|uniref:winged helix-turn-helix domain-containing protein n=4 Tax=Vibrio cholerae TaxID=666 RepID=UPI001157EBAD|nr:winged helix-turn-helix domain-containing protein [Vibrio cholerae]TQO64659.1 transcriptional regulator [Vibrio cholerae]
MYKIDQKILSSDSPFLTDSISREQIKLGTHEHLVLLALCEQAGKLIDKETLIKKGWPGKFVTDSSLTQAVRNIRAYLNDDGKSQKHIKTIAKKGYFIESKFVTLIQDFDKNQISKLQQETKKESFDKKNILFLSIFIQILFIIYSIYKIYPITTVAIDKEIYPILSYQQDYIYIYSDDFQYSEQLGVELIHSLSAERISPERLYIMLNKETVSYSFIEKNGKSKNRIIFTAGNKDYNKIREHIINEIKI